MKLIAHGLLLGLLLPAAVLAQTVTFNGRMGDKALLVIQGQARVVGTGQTVDGVTLDAVSADEARVHVAGRAAVLRPGTPTSLGGSGGGGAVGREIILPVGPGGHYFVNGMINHASVRFVVDTGATMISLGTGDAERMGLDYRSGQPVMMGTANGTAMAWRVLLPTVRVGDVEVHQVQAVVQPGLDGIALLGNSFLSHFDLQRSGDTMRLTRKD
jgi:aspartyl protease family protein